MFRADKTHWPFVYQRVVGGLSDADLAAVETYMRDTLQAGGRTYSVIDCRGAERPDSAVRQRLAGIMKAHAPAEDATLQPTVIAFIFDSRLVAGAMTALRWLVPSKSPEIFASNALEAIQFLATECRREGIAVPEAFRSMVLEAQKRAG